MVNGKTLQCWGEWTLLPSGGPRVTFGHRSVNKRLPAKQEDP
jgi:hypothetical protein